MKKIFAAAFAAAFGLASMAQATLIEFDTSGLLMEDTSPSMSGSYTPMGTFKYDTVTDMVFDVSVTTPFAVYTSGFTFPPILPGDNNFILTDGFGFELDIFAFEVELAIAGLVPGDMFSVGADPLEFSPMLSLIGTPIDPTLFGTILPDPMAAIPLPASLPLLLAGIGVFGLIRRKS